MKTIAFFNNKGGVGKTTLVYHFTYMLAELGYRSLAIDLDPQTNLSSMFLDDNKLQMIYTNENSRHTIIEGIRPLNKGIGDIAPATVHQINENIGLIAGDLDLSLFEDKLSHNWGRCLDRDEVAFRITSAFYRIIKQANKSFDADFNIIDVGPNFGAINRATLIAADYVIIPMAADLFSLQGLKNLGNRLNQWKREWMERSTKNPEPDSLELPTGEMTPLGYIVMQHGIKERRPVKSYLAWANRIPQVYQEFVLKCPVTQMVVEDDPNCLALLKHYHSLVPMAMEARKPIFLLKPADGAIGAHLGAVRRAHMDFEILTKDVIVRLETSPIFAI